MTRHIEETYDLQWFNRYYLVNSKRAQTDPRRNIPPTPLNRQETTKESEEGMK